MPTIAQQFFLGTVDDDQTGGTTIKKIQETAPAANSATTNTWTTTTVETRTHVPLAASSVNSDTSNTNGWCYNNGGADGLGSTSTAERWIKPGVWNFSMSYTLNSPALLATIACTVTARVYRVATGGGTRTLLFTAASANFSATGVITWNSASQPEYILAAGEVIQVAFTASSAATAATVLGAITNTVLTLNLGSNSFFNVPTPGVRTLGRGDYALTGVGTLAGALSKLLAAVYALTGSGVLAGAGGSRFAAVFALAGSGAANMAGGAVSASQFAMTGLGTLTGRITRIISSVYSMNSGGSGGTTIRKIFNIFDDE